MFRNARFFQSRLFEIAVLVLIAALVYLPNIGKMTYYKDDWYYIHDASISGPGVFPAMFAIDRPARGPFFEVYYSLFGYQPLPYHIGEFLWRVAAVIGALWLFNILWPHNRRSAFSAALLFAVYPGYLWWVSAVEYQPMIASLALEVLSIAFTLKAIQSNRQLAKFAYAAAAILTGWTYIALVDYAIGMEVFRFLCIFILMRRSRRSETASIWNAAAQSVRVWLTYLLIPIGFLVWREFFFANTRRATDVGLQLGVFLSSPSQTTVNWLIHLAESVLNVGLFAWITPFANNFFSLYLHEMGIAIIIMCIVILVITMRNHLVVDDVEMSEEPDKVLSSEAIWVGLLGTAFGVLPVILANRYVEFQAYSHYGLPASLAGVMLVVGLVNSTVFAHLRSVIMIVLVATASLTHYAVSIHALALEQAVQQFWWQMAWRAPGIQPNITMVINYPSANIGDDGYAVMDAPDLLYYPRTDAAIPVHYVLSAVSANDENAKTVLVGHLTKDESYRTSSFTIDFSNVLVLSQPSDTSCVHAIDGKQAIVSAQDPSSILQIAPRSAIGNILPEAVPVVPQGAIFGPEPAHRWCYYYEKMDLAIQTGNWKEAVALGNKAIELGFHPGDQSEWIPLVMAYAMNGDTNGIKMTAPKINQNPFLRNETCQLFSNGENSRIYLPEIQALLLQSFCRAGK